MKKHDQDTKLLNELERLKTTISNQIESLGQLQNPSEFLRHIDETYKYLLLYKERSKDIKSETDTSYVQTTTENLKSQIYSILCKYPDLTNTYAADKSPLSIVAATARKVNNDYTTLINDIYSGVQMFQQQKLDYTEKRKMCARAVLVKELDEMYQTTNSFTEKAKTLSLFKQSEKNLLHLQATIKSGQEKVKYVINEIILAAFESRDANRETG